MDVVTLYNMALGKVGTRTTVSATTEGSTEANQCNVHYAPTRDKVLRSAPWNFCRKQALLTQLKSSIDVNSTCPSPWGFEYAWPSDCLRARFILPQIPASAQLGGIPLTSAGASATPLFTMGPPVKFIVGVDSDTSGNTVRVILTNQYQAQLVYTFAATDSNLFDAEFIEALTTALAANIALNLTGDKEITKLLKVDANRLAKEASATNGSEGLEVKNSTPDWIGVRGYVADDYRFGFNSEPLFQVDA